MKRLAASISAITLAVGAVLLAPSAAQADEATATISDPTGDIDRRAGASKKHTSDVTKFGIAYDTHTVTATWWFKNLRQGTAKHFSLDLGAVEYGVDYVLAKLPGVAAGLYPYGSTAGDALCEAEIDQKTGANGRYRVSFDRSCLVPEGQTGKVKTLGIAPVWVGGADGWADALAVELALGPAIPSL